MAPTKKPNIMLFHERGDDIAALFGTEWTMDVFTSDFPSFVRDVPAVYEVETGAVHCGRDAVRAFHERHTPRPKARERAAVRAPPPPKKSVTIDTFDTTSTVPAPTPAEPGRSVPGNADPAKKEKTVPVPIAAPPAASPAPTTSSDTKQTVAEPKKKVAAKKRTTKAT